MAKLVEGLWDCPYCGNKGIGGLTKRCPACSHAQDAGTKFYLPNQKKYLNEDKVSEYGQGADWVCAYCGAMNHHDVENCTACGAPREDKQGDYFTVKEQAAAREQQRKQAEAEFEPVKKRSIWPFVAVLLAFVGLMALLFTPRHAEAVVSELRWARTISIEQLVTQQEADWDVPSGARVTNQQQELKGYRQVLDHYESVPVERSQEVLDHYEDQVSYTDNGDGTFAEHVTSYPVYRTEYYTVMEDRPVYRDEPVYATRYYYDIDRWIPSRTVDSSGIGDTPYWGEFTLAENERESGRRGTYTMLLSAPKDKTYTLQLPEALWSSFSVGDKPAITVVNGRVTELNGTPLA